METNLPDGQQSDRDASALFERGRALLEKLHGGHAGEALINDVKEICPDFATMSVEWALGGVMARPGLDLLTRTFVVIASCATLGFAGPQLAAHIEAALALGATRTQIVEALLQLTFYAGGPATRNALGVAEQVFNKLDKAL
jgi:4-carboxymuconolactone decarboxylase